MAEYLGIPLGFRFFSMYRHLDFFLTDANGSAQRQAEFYLELAQVIRRKPAAQHLWFSVSGNSYRRTPNTFLCSPIYKLDNVLLPSKHQIFQLVRLYLAIHFLPA